MLKHLRIQNIILVEQAEIPFNAGLNILTGETGAGKSAVMGGLSLAVGERSDTSMIRRGCEKGVVEATFEIDHHPLLPSLLEEAGIDHEPGQELIIKREISSTGKSRVFINHQVVQLALLRKIGASLVHIVGQHANQQLFSLDHHRNILDLYGNLSFLVHDFKKSFDQENLLCQEIETLVREEAQRLREIDICQREIEELEEAQLKEEDEDLFTEYTLLINSKELSEKVYEINQALNGEKQSLIAALHRQKAVLEALVRMDPSLKETAQAFQNALVEIQEVSHTLRHYQGALHADPDRLDFINDRLTLINRLKRKYGATLTEIQTYQARTQIRLEQLENADLRIEKLQAYLQEAQENTHQLASKLTQKRIEIAQQLEQAVTKQLHALNMPKAEFTIKVSSQKRSSLGDDKVEFFLLPNIGEHQIALKEGASGGEISRILLALQTLLAGKEQTSTLLFDEVDANIGGETAAIVGSKLREIGQRHQVICVTHFPQVASCAHYHLQIAKQEKEGRTVTIIQSLDSASQQRELERMVGRRN